MRVICLDLSRLVEKSQVTECERSKFLSGVRGMGAEVGSYQDSGFASISAKPRLPLFFADLCKHGPFRSSSV